MSNFKEDLMQVKAFAFDVDGVLSAQITSTDINGVPVRTANIKDGYAIHAAAGQGYTMAIITGGNTEAVAKRYKDLGIEDVYMEASNKIEQLNDWMEKRNLKPENIMYMGDDLPDEEVMRTVGLPVCPADAAVEIKVCCKYISSKEGGRGCVRDVIEQVMRVHGKWGVNKTW